MARGKNDDVGGGDDSDSSDIIYHLLGTDYVPGLYCSMAVNLLLACRSAYAPSARAGWTSLAGLSLLCRQP